MATRELSLFADLDQGRLVQSFFSTTQAATPKFVIGDSIPVFFRPLTRIWNNGANPWQEVDLTGKTVRVAIGNPGGLPTAGTFTLLFSGQVTAALWFNATAADIQTAINALSTITTAGGVTVTRSTGGVIRITFNSTAAVSAFTADTSALYPATGAEVFVSVAGSTTARAVVVIRLETLPAAYVELTTDFPAAASSIVNVRTGSSSVGAIQSLLFTVLPYGGFYTLTIGSNQTLGIPWDSDAAALQSALEAIASVGVGKVSVSGEFPHFALNFAVSLGNIGTMAINMSALIVPKGRSGMLNTNTSGMVEILNGSPQAQAKIEVELYDTSQATTWTVIQTDCVVIDDVIGNSPLTVAGGPAYSTADALSAQRITVIRYSPVTGFAITADPRQDQFQRWTPAAALATGSFTFPVVADCLDGQQVLVNTSQNIAAMTFLPGTGNTLTGAPTSLVSGIDYVFIYDATASEFIRIGGSVSGGSAGATSGTSAFTLPISGTPALMVGNTDDQFFDVSGSANFANYAGSATNASNASAAFNGFFNTRGGLPPLHPGISIDSDVITAAGFVGNIIQSPPATATPTTNGQMLFEATSNTSLTVRLKGTDGIVRSVVMTLAP